MTKWLSEVGKYDREDVKVGQMGSGRSDWTGTASQILDVAERLVQVRGFNAFSYADIATELNVTTAALHYHFAGKAELGEALIMRYAARFNDGLAGIESQIEDAASRLEAYAALYLGVLVEKRMCLCGMLAAEYQTLPEPMRSAVVQFFAENEAWLTRVLEEGRDKGALHFEGSADDVAWMVVSSLEGALLVARPLGDISRFRFVAEQLLATLKSPSSAPAFPAM